MRSVTVGSYNVHWGRRPGSPRKCEPFDVVDACRRLDVDILAMQEVWRPDGGPSVADEVAAALGYEVYHAWTARAIVKPKCQIVGRTGGSEGDGDWGQALLRRVPTGPVTEQRLSGFLMDATDRTVLKTEVDLDGTTLTVCGSHLPHLEHMSPLLRWRLRDVIPGKHEPAVLMGDFNMWRWVARFVAPGWKDTVRGATWPAHRFPVFQIDHLLATPPVLATDAEVVHTGKSDHLPIRAHLSLR
ncbi:MAG: endonuclease/exonuclease/phosphatase family protein [Acidimicrobiia bacterium]|nr:endonuclease/exonuclease/phosphatase family protein [Acidimicrobiia bacterium]